MAWSRKKKILVGVLGTFLALGGALGVYILVWMAKHKTQYGKQHHISKKEKKDLKKLEAMLTKCGEQVFTHKKLAADAPPGAKEKGYKTAIKVVMASVKTCLKGHKSADGKGFSPTLTAKVLAGWVAPKDCNGFVEKFLEVGCPSKIGNLSNKIADGGAGFKSSISIPKDLLPPD